MMWVSKRSWSTSIGLRAPLRGGKQCGNLSAWTARRCSPIWSCRIPSASPRSAILMGAEIDLALPISVIAPGQVLNITAATTSTAIRSRFWPLPRRCPTSPGCENASCGLSMAPAAASISVRLKRDMDHLFEQIWTYEIARAWSILSHPGVKLRNWRSCQIICRRVRRLHVTAGQRPHHRSSTPANAAPAPNSNGGSGSGATANPASAAMHSARRRRPSPTGRAHRVR